MTSDPDRAGRRWPDDLRRYRPAAIAVAMLAVAIGAITALGPAAGGETTAGPAAVTVTKVDATADPVELVVAGTAGDRGTGPVELVAGGAVVEGLSTTAARTADRATEVVLVVDVGARGLDDDVLERVKAELEAAVSSLPPSVEVAVIAAGDRAMITTRLTSDRARLVEAIDGLSARTGSALLDGVGLAADVLGDDPTVIQSVLVVSTGSDDASSTSVGDARAGLQARSAQLVVVGVGGVGDGLGSIASATGGTAVPAERSSAAVGVGTGWDLASDRLLVAFPAPAEMADRTTFNLNVGDASTAFSFPLNVVTTSALQLAPMTPANAGSPNFFQTSTGLYLALGLSFVGIVLGVWSLASIMVGREATLDGMLSTYTERSAGDPEEVEEALVQSAILQRAVDFSESFAERQGFLARIENLLERANLPMRAGEAMFLLSAIVLLSVGLVAAMTQSLLTSAIVGAGVTGLCFFVLRFLGRRRFKAFEGQLPDTLQLLSGTLRAGYSLPQGLEAVSQEIADPMGQELRRAMTEARLGRELEESLNGVAERMASPDFAWAVMAIAIQREVGGNLNELLLSVADTMIARERLKREISALTAEGRVSAGILSFLPPGLGLIMWVMNPAYVELLFTEFLGNVLLGLGTVSALVGLAWMRKVITVDV